MSWLATIGIALLTAAVGLVLGGYLASLAVGWYRVSSFEGSAGYFVVALALLGAVAGLVLGLVVGRVGAASFGFGFWKALLASQLTLVGIAAIVGGIARLAADVAPTLDGETMLLQVEIRWPASASVTPATDATPREIRLTSVSRGRARNSREGALWTEDTRREEGRCPVIPGRRSSRGARGCRARTTAHRSPTDSRCDSRCCR
jgi:hypothetical protein